MGVRFRKSKKIGPFRISASKSGISTSFGVKGARVTRTAGGKTRVTASVPGTGISWSEQVGGSKKTAAKSQRNAKKGGSKVKKGWIIAGAIVLIGAVGSTKDETKTTVEVTPAAVEETEPVRAMALPVETEEPEETPEPTPEPEPEETPEPTPTPRIEHTYIQNINTGVVHEPGCRYEKQMKPENKAEITCTRDELYAAGYNLCDTCLR